MLTLYDPTTSVCAIKVRLTLAKKAERQHRAPWPLRRVPAAEVAVPRALFAEILHRIDGLRPQPPLLPA